ncbi:MAG TPA: cupredoxin domain-containing protein [Thermoanaerobaculia bacterium]|nr:cupredoxin domain-containing protein [Thermoanaerobaculia bacterium]
MTPGDWAAVLLGAAAIAWVNWYFFLAKRSAATASAGAGGAQEVTITVQGGYEPAEVKVKRGLPVRLIFDRRETSSCSEEVVIPDFGIRKFLPAFQKTPVELTPEKAGAFDITCGMSMLHGKLIVEA